MVPEHLGGHLGLCSREQGGMDTTPTPHATASRDCISPPQQRGGAHGSHGQGSPWVWYDLQGIRSPWVSPKAQWPPSVWGNTLARRLAGGYLTYLFPWCILPDGPPNTRGPLEVLVGLFHRFFGLSWETSGHSRVLFT